MVNENWAQVMDEAIAREGRRKMAVKLLLHAQEGMLLHWAGASGKRRAELWRNLHKAGDDVRDAWGDELS